MHYSKPRYGRRKEAGICVMCLKAPVEPDKVHCASCADLRSLRRYGKPRKKPNQKVPIALINLAESSTVNAQRLGISRTAVCYWLKKLKP